MLYKLKVEGGYTSPTRAERAVVLSEARLSGWGMSYYFKGGVIFKMLRGLSMGVEIGKEFLRIEELSGKETMDYAGLNVYESWMRDVKLVMADNQSGGREFRLLDSTQMETVPHYPAPFIISGIRINLETSYEF